MSDYLQWENWPECIPWMGPQEEYGPYPWGDISHENPYGVDEYPHTHPAAGSLGDLYMGDICPQCGKPLRYNATVVNIRGTRGELHAVSPDENPIPCYHPGCWADRESEIHGHENATLDAFTDQ